MIRVDEDDPVGEVALSFPHRNVQIRRGLDPKELYELKTEIGRGKFGTVFKCIEKGTGLCLAAKFIGVSKKEDRRNVEREVDIMRCLQHPRLLQIYDAFENGKMMCVILELIDGGELFERVIDDDFILTEKSCTVFMRQICEGVDFIHKQRILHLDMKPENILCLTKTGNRIKIIDFGLARKYDPDKKLQVLFGTPEFVAPEVVNFDQIGYGTDMWSVGVICYVLLSGLSPFMGSTDVETMANVTVGKYDFEDEAFREISPTAKDFISKLLVKDINIRMSAEDSLNHNWLLRRTTEVSNMEVTKDNLKQFVERWNDHPNSPYVFESSSHIISPCYQSGKLRLSESLHSLEGMSPSPCGSLASSIESDDAFPQTFIGNGIVDDMESSLNVPHSDCFRRASDSTCVLKGNDVAERLNLADEIRKLTDKLFQLSAMPETKSNPNFDINGGASKRPSESFPIPINQRNGVKPKSSNNSEIPWRRPKFRVTTSSRDVPLAPKTTTTTPFVTSKHFRSDILDLNINSMNNHNKGSLMNSSSELHHQRGDGPIMDCEVNGTKNMLLRLLDQWDGPQMPRPSQRHSSISTEWTEGDSLGQKTISSLNLFFQSRSTIKKNHPFMKPNGFNNV